MYLKLIEEQWRNVFEIVRRLVDKCMTGYQATKNY